MWKQMKEAKHLYVLMAPFIILFFTFTIIPVVMSLGISSRQFHILEAPRFVGFDNYIKLLLDDEIFIIAIRNTLVLAVVTGPVSYLLAFVFAWLINELKPRLRAFMTLVFYAPSISGNAFLIWLLIFSGDIHGYANGFLKGLGLIDNPIIWLRDPDYMLMVLIIVQLWLSLGVSFLAFI